MDEEQADSFQATLGKILELLPQETNFRRHSTKAIPEIVQALTSAAKVFHWYLVCDFGGRTGGERSPGLVEQAVAAAFQRFGDYNPYRSHFDKAAAMFRGIARGHPFTDGNKRTSFYLVMYYLDNTGYPLPNNLDEQAVVDLCLEVAEGKIEDVLEISNRLCKLWRRRARRKTT